MTTNFFSSIIRLNTPGIWKLIIETDAEGNLTVSELFTIHTCGDKAAQLIAPLSLKGTAQELDEHFFNSVTAPIQKVAGLQTSMEAHLKSVEAAKAASKLEQDKKAKTKTPAAATASADEELPDSKAEKKKEYDESMRAIAQLNDEMKYEEAIACCRPLPTIPKKRMNLKPNGQTCSEKKTSKRRPCFYFNYSP